MLPVDILRQALQVNPAVAKLVLGGLAVIAAAAMVVTWSVNPDALYRVGAAVLGFAVAAMVLAKIHGLLATVLAWFVTLGAMAYVTLGAAQFAASDELPLPKTRCFVQMTLPGCPLAPMTMMADAGSPEAAPPSPPSEAAPAPSIVAPAPSDGADEADSQRAAPWIGRTVYIHFAGRLSRDDAIELAAALVADGWKVEGAAQGGERLTAAYGLNEVRFFHAEDADAAATLAGRIAASGVVGAVAVRDVTRMRAPKGNLEVWISLR